MLDHVRSSDRSARHDHDEDAAAPVLVRSPRARPRTKAAARSDGPGTVVRLVDVDPDLAAALSPAEAALIAQYLVVPGLRVSGGAWEPPELDGVLAVLVVDGVLLREHTADGRADLQLCGPGDYLDPRLLGDPDVTWRVVGSAHLALVDDRFLTLAGRCPSLVTALLERVFEAHRTCSTMAALRALPRVEERLVTLLTHFSNRWGRVTSRGVVLELAITHDELGRLVGARRPTVSLALKDLAGAGVVERLDQDRWLLPATAARRDLPANALPVPA